MPEHERRHMAKMRSVSWYPRLASCVLLLFGLLLTALPGHAAPRIGVVTMQPGEVFWERFGHDAIVVDDPLHGPISYNFGYFDLDEPDFVVRFLRGRMSYQLVALPLEVDLRQYRDNGRGVRVQWLDLSPQQANRLAAALAENALPENARYDYDYFRDNCATRVRDALDFALDGALGPQLGARSHGLTYRSEATRLAAPAPWMWLGFQLGLGPNADRPLSLWEESFIPMRLADALRDAKTAAGTPLVLAEEEWLPHRLDAEPSSGTARLSLFAALGLLLATLLYYGARQKPRAAAGFALGFWLLCGLLGVLMLYLWLGSAHWSAWRNHNLLLLNPLAWLLLPGAWALLRGRPPSPRFRLWLWLPAALALLALALAAIGIDHQANAAWIALLLPLHLALAMSWARRARAGTAP
ncbi:lipoprotein N-acyltransferase Lnb domain-containing protein [Luteimonas sp. e5]